MAQVSIMVPSPTRAPTLTKLGISTTPLAMKAERRTIAPGTARKPAAAKALFVPARRNLESTLSHQDRATRRVGDDLHVVQPERQQHGFLQPLMHLPCRRRSFRPPRSEPSSSPASAVSTASRASPLLVDTQGCRGRPRLFRCCCARSFMSNPDGGQESGSGP